MPADQLALHYVRTYCVRLVVTFPPRASPLSLADAIVIVVVRVPTPLDLRSGHPIIARLSVAMQPEKS